jgi:hypothetical protein
MEDQTGLDGPDGIEDAAAMDEEVQAAPAAAEAEPRPEPVPATGEPRVDAALRLLDRLPGLPVSEHPALFERVHAQLSDVLGELDSGSAGPGGG